MFEPSERPRLFAAPIGVDFGRALVEGLESRLEGAAPEAWGRVTIFVNTTRMRRHLLDLFAAGPARLLPRIRLVTDLASDPSLGPLLPATPTLQLQLELRQAVARLIELQPNLAPHHAAFDLATSLAALLDEMHGEGIEPERLRELDVAEHSEHWANSLKLLSILSGQNSDVFRGAEALNRDAAIALVSRWLANPPQDPVLVAGSTGSRGTTRLLMEAVAKLPQGAVILPGFDFDQSAEVWETLLAGARDPERLPEEDHPQYRFAALMAGLGVSPEKVRPWSTLAPVSPARNALVSLALRPAPVTDQWRRDGPELAGDLPQTAASLSLIEAPSPRHEADAIALALREAVADGRSAALVTPDRTLARQVSAALRQWNIVADDSAGLPLHQSPPGRFLIELCALYGRPPELPAVLSLLKHPLAVSTAGQRGPHLLLTRRFELWARGNARAHVTSETLSEWAAHAASDEATSWAEWVTSLISGLETAREETLEARLSDHIARAERLAAGPAVEGSGELWKAAAGEVAREAVEALHQAAPSGGVLGNTDYFSLFRDYLTGETVRESTVPHPGVAIWGTIEARTRMMDLCILAGLNEGTWPASVPQDPWMNRAMRRQAGMLLPERRIGLSAHDFQQALGARHAILSRSLRDAEAETVPARWLNRLMNLLGGLGEAGTTALADMRSRGQRLVDSADALARHPKGGHSLQLPAPRPSPAPPVAARPRSLYVTSVATLIRDPYSIYARQILRLRSFGPRAPRPDAALRGTVLHAVMETALRDQFDFTGPPEERVADFLALASRVIGAQVPWAATGRLWLARLATVAPEIVRREAAMQETGSPVVIEEKGSVSLRSIDFKVSAKPDRIDKLDNGTCAVLDYKSATNPPSSAQVEKFDKQLLIEAAIAEAGGFSTLGAARASRVGYISLGRPENSRDEPLDVDGQWRPDTVLQDLATLIARYDNPATGYTARRAPHLLLYESDYDHLSRYGEWDDTTAPELIEVGR